MCICVFALFVVTSKYNVCLSYINCACVNNELSYLFIHHYFLVIFEILIFFVMELVFPVRICVLGFVSLDLS